MNKQRISLPDFVKAFKVLIGNPIWRVIHPADGWLIIDLGQRYTGTIPGAGGLDEPYDKGQYRLHIAGDWEVYSGNKLIETRKVFYANQKEYFDRMDKLIQNFPVKVIEAIRVEHGAMLMAGSNAYIRIPISKNPDSISLTEVELDSFNNAISYTHYRYEEALCSFVKVA